MTLDQVLADARPVCAEEEHDRVYSDLYPWYASATPGKANPIRCYWICRRCGQHGAILFRCNHRVFEELVEKFQRNPRIDLQWSVVDYAERWLAERPCKGNQVSTVLFGLGTVAAIRDDLDWEIQRRIDERARREVEESVREALDADRGLKRGAVVYFIRNVDTGLIKIGTTICLSNRLAALRLGGGSELEVLGVLPGAQTLEAEAHARWAALRVRGEWFSPGQELLEWIQQNAQREQVA